MKRRSPSAVSSISRMSAVNAHGRWLTFELRCFQHQQHVVALPGEAGERGSFLGPT